MVSHLHSAADPGGGEGAMPPPPSLLKLVIKKMAAIRGTLYFMFLAPPPELPGSDADITVLMYSTAAFAHFL